MKPKLETLQLCIFGWGYNMILTKMKSFKQPKYAEKAYNKLQCIVTFSSFNNIKSRSSTKCMARSYWTDHIPSSDIVASKIVWFFFLNVGMSLQYNIKEGGEWLLNYALQGGIYNSNSNQLRWRFYYRYNSVLSHFRGLGI